MKSDVMATIVIAIASLVAAPQTAFYSSSVCAQDGAKSAQELRAQRFKSIDPGSPDSLEQLLNDPLFNVEEGRISSITRRALQS